MLIERFNPAPLSELEVRLQNEVIACGKVFPVREKGDPLQIRFVRSSAGWVGESSMRIVLSIDNRRAEIWIEPELESGIAERLREFGGGKTLPIPFQQALQGMVARGIIDAVENLVQLPVALDLQESNEEAGAALKELCFELLSEKSTVEGRGKVLLPGDIVERVLEVAGRMPARLQPNLSGLPLRGHLIFGSVKLSIVEYRTLEVGAILLLNEPCALASGKAAFMLEDGGIVPVDVQPESLRRIVVPLSEPRLRGEVSLEGFSPPGQTTSVRNSPISKIEIVVSFGSGSGNLTLDEVLGLTKSGVPEGKVKIYRPVQIFANGRAAGSGELIEIKGRRGLFITSLSI